MAEDKRNNKTTNIPTVESFKESVQKKDRGTAIANDSKINTVRNTMPAPTKPGNGGKNTK